MAWARLFVGTMVGLVAGSLIASDFLGLAAKLKY
jgi:hypothetical protein